MMAEPTLGRRIMIEATICKDAPPGTAMARKAWADLRALCARADAAERMAVALATSADAWPDRTAKWAEVNEALADWRAITGEVDG